MRLGTRRSRDPSLTEGACARNQVIGALPSSWTPPGDPPGPSFVVRGWGGRNVFTPETALLNLDDGLVRSVGDMFDHRWVEAYRTGEEPMFTAYPRWLSFEQFGVVAALSRTWTVGLSPYSNRLRNHGLRLSFSQYPMTAAAVAAIEAAHFIEAPAGAVVQHATRVVPVGGDGRACVQHGGGSIPFYDMLDALIADTTWRAVCSDEGHHRDYPCLQVTFDSIAAAQAFAERLG